MSIQIFNGVRNLASTPGILTDTFANRPTATTLAEGTLFYASDTPDIYQVISGSWKACGGGGGSQDLQSVLTVGSILTQNNIIDANSLYYLTFAHFDGYAIHSTYFELKDILNTETYLYINTATNGLAFGRSNIDNWYKIEAVSGVYLYSHYTAGGNSNYFVIDLNNNDYKLGDFYGTNNSTYFRVDDAHQANESYADTYNFNEINIGQGTINFNGTGYESATAGSNTTKHLVVYVNGNQYKIQLKNP